MSTRPIEASRLTIAITGASGMIGSALASHLREKGHTVRRIVRDSGAREPGDIRWNPADGELAAADLAGVDAIVNLAGESIAQRWTAGSRREILDSRVGATSTLAKAIAAMPVKPAVVLSGSAVGYYGNGGERDLDERSPSGDGFLASVTREWEGAAKPIGDMGVRLVLLRTGVVLSSRGGALAKLLPPFRLGLGGPIGDGSQWMSWISLTDHVRAMAHLIGSTAVNGAVNIVSPDAARNANFARTLGAVLHRPALIPLPGFALELAYGEMARETILWGQRVLPSVLVEHGFEFSFPRLHGALEHELS